MSFILQTIGVWIICALFAIVNGGVRNALYQPHMRELSAHQLSSITGIIGFLIIYYLFMRLTNIPLTYWNMFVIGSTWLVMTILFEFVFGHYVMGHPWSRLFADYNILKGRVWSLVLLVVWLGPVSLRYFFFK